MARPGVVAKAPVFCAMNNVFTNMGVKEFTFELIRKTIDKITIYY